MKNVEILYQLDEKCWNFVENVDFVDEECQNF